MILDIIEIFGWYRSYSWTIGIADHLIVLDFLFLYIYVNAMLSPKTGIGLRFFLIASFLVLLSTILFTIKLYMLPLNERFDLMAGILKGNVPLWLSLYISAITFVIIGLIIHSLVKSQKLEKRPKKVDASSLKTFKFFLLSLAVVYGISVFANTLQSASGDQKLQLLFVFYPALLIGMSFAGFFGFRQRVIFLLSNSIDSDHSLLDKYNFIYKKLNQVMEEDQLYLTEDLTLSQVSVAIKENPKYVSESLRANRQKSFSNYVNSFRLREVKRIMDDKAYSHWTLLAIALEAGFPSKATFNRVFKKMEGITPSEYKERIQ